MLLLKSPKRLKGFSIAEVVLSSFLLTTGMVTIMSLFSLSHRSSSDSRDVIIATQLAQEGVELVRNVRDNNIAYRTENWTTGDNCSTSTSVDCDPFRYFPDGMGRRCVISYDSSPTSDISCSGTPATALALNNAGLYQHGGGVTSTRFHRLLKIDHTSGSDTARIQSFVSWQDPGSNLNGNGATTWCIPYNKCVYTELLLYNWK